MYLQSFNYFRGIAIVFIVAGHCLYMSGWAIDSVGEKLIANLILGGTSLFVFISGFLFHHIYYSRFTFRKFITTKVKNVLTPYLILSLPLILYSVIVKGSGPYAQYIFSGKPGILATYLQPVLSYLWTGRILEAYWYIPFIMIVFLLSPVFILFIRLQPKVQIMLVALFFAVSLFGQRPVLNLAVLQSVVYFLPVYLIGMLVSIHRLTIYKYFSKRQGYLLGAVILLAFAQAYFYPSFGNHHKPFWQFSPPDILLVQKIVMCLFFMVFLNRFEKTIIPFLDKLASASFAIYFIHPYVLWGVQLLLNKRYPLLIQTQGPLLWLLMTPAVILTSLGIATVVRYLFKSRSRSIIGW